MGPRIIYLLSCKRQDVSRYVLHDQRMSIPGGPPQRGLDLSCRQIIPYAMLVALAGGDPVPCRVSFIGGCRDFGERQKVMVLILKRMILCGVLASCVGCGDSSSTGAAPAAAVGAGNCGAIQSGRGVSEPCCEAYGVDACGAGLVCAALDGRTASTCYVEGSRADGKTCTADALCVSGACDKTLHTCGVPLGGLCTYSPDGSTNNCGTENGAKLACSRPIVNNKADGALVCTRMDPTSDCAPCNTKADCVKAPYVYDCLGGRCNATSPSYVTVSACCGQYLGRTIDGKIQCY